MKKQDEKLAVYAFGVIFVAISLILALFIPNPTQYQYTVFRTVLSLACAGVVTFIPGFLEVEFGWRGNSVRAIGAIAAFVLIYLVNPAQLLTTPPPISGVVLGPDQYPPESIIEQQPTPNELQHVSEIPAKDVNFYYKNDTDEDLKLFVFDFWKKHHPSGGPFDPKTFWSAWPFPADKNFREYKQFRETNGLFAFAVGRLRSDGKSVEVYFLETKNIFYSKTPAMTVSKSNDPERPFNVTFTERLHNERCPPISTNDDVCSD